MDFWDSFFLFLIFIPLIMIWVFALFDIFRRDDMSGWLKALWVVVIILLPFLGTLIYLIFRPAGATVQERQAIDAASRASMVNLVLPTAPTPGRRPPLVTTASSARRRRRGSPRR